MSIEGKKDLNKYFYDVCRLKVNFCWFINSSYRK